VAGRELQLQFSRFFCALIREGAASWSDGRRGPVVGSRSASFEPGISMSGARSGESSTGGDPAGRADRQAGSRSDGSRSDAATGDVTTLLRAWGAGDAEAFDRVLPVVYEELHRMAARYLAGERSNASLQATALVNELCLRLLGWNPVRWQNRGHFFGVSAQMMRRVLVDIARRRGAERRGGPLAVRVPLDEVDVAATEPDDDLLAVDDALRRLALEDERKARVVELRFFGGMSVEEIAEALGVSARTVHSDWVFARAWLHRTLTGADAD
jgi:RNA polymerase sigma-70 factor (ECF subfamily)